MEINFAGTSQSKLDITLASKIASKFNVDLDYIGYARSLNSLPQINAELFAKKASDSDQIQAKKVVSF